MNKDLKRKLKNFAIPGIMRYVVTVYAIGSLLAMFAPTFYYEYLMFDVDRILDGEIWRLVTFIIQPIGDDLFVIILTMFVYYAIGNSLEQMLGSHRFTLFYITGILFNALGVILFYVITWMIYGIGLSLPISFSYLNSSMFLIYALMFPDTVFRLYFLIPIKGKYLLWFDLALYAIDIFNSFNVSGVLGGTFTIIAIGVSLINFFIFFLRSRSFASIRNIKRRNEFSRKYTAGMMGDRHYSRADDGTKVITRHKCAICGKTELDGIDLEFRFCSKCNGNYEYCKEHLFTHEHVK